MAHSGKVCKFASSHQKCAHNRKHIASGSEMNVGMESNGRSVEMVASFMAHFTIIIIYNENTDNNRGCIQRSRQR